MITLEHWLHVVVRLKSSNILPAAFEKTAAVKKENRESDLLGRLGGEDFCVVLVQKGMDGALLLAERLRLVTEAMRVPCDVATIQVTVSRGVTE